MEFFKNLSLTQKLVSGFVTVAVVLLIVGGIGYRAVTSLGEDAELLMETSPLVEAAMEMMIAVDADKLGIMEMIEQDNIDDMNVEWKLHGDNVKYFDLFAEGILKGAETNMGTIYAAKDETLKAIVREADKKHNNEFQPAIRSVYDHKLEEFEAMAKLDAYMLSMEESYDRMMAASVKLEEGVKERIDSKVRAGASAEKILAVENVWADLSMEMMILLGKARIALEEAAQGLEAAQHESVVKRYHEASEAFDGLMAALMKGGSVEGAAVPRIHVASLRARVEEMAEIHEKKFEPASEAMLGQVARLVEVRAEIGAADEAADEIGSQMSEILEGVEDGAKEELSSISANVVSDIAQSTKTMITGIVIGFVIALALGILLSRSIVRPISRAIDEIEGGADQVASASAQLSSSSQSLSEGATEQAASLEETSASLEEISSTIQQSSDNANQARQLATVARETADKGASSVKNLVVAVDEINKSSDEVSKIIKVIDEIAFQTNLLALNAAVEAARAGEHGKGFAVVAEEVRNLAGRSAEAAKNTASLIEGSTAKAKEGSDLANEAGVVLDEIVTNVTKVSDLIADIASASREQAEGINQVTTAITQMDQVTQQNSALSEESASASEELNSQSETLKELVFDMVSVISGTKSYERRD
ncbi:MAG: hypothetical protein IMF07_08290, partial [Proteobacteria bacterium]|nr:hypothetical protein [Pseudomonadota bacterium]